MNVSHVTMQWISIRWERICVLLGSRHRAEQERTEIEMCYVMYFQVWKRRHSWQKSLRNKCLRIPRVKIQSSPTQPLLQTKQEPPPSALSCLPSSRAAHPQFVRAFSLWKTPDSSSLARKKERKKKEINQFPPMGTKPRRLDYLSGAAPQKYSFVPYSQQTIRPTEKRPPALPTDTYMHLYLGKVCMYVCIIPMHVTFPSILSYHIISYHICPGSPNHITHLHIQISTSSVLLRCKYGTCQTQVYLSVGYKYKVCLVEYLTCPNL